MCPKELANVCKVAKAYMGIEKFVLTMTIGTTFTGAVDDVFALTESMGEAGINRRADVHIHADAALNGGFWNILAANGRVERLRLGHEIDSLSISGHKWYGGFIGGVVLMGNPPAVSGIQVPYLSFTDRMASGSKDGLVAPKWHARLRQFNWEEELRRCETNAQYLMTKLSERNIQSAKHNPGIIVVFPKPSDEFCDRFQLATQDQFAHVCVMPHITVDILDMFLDELDSDICPEVGKPSIEMMQPIQCSF
mmetsp:Transcript_25581/g.61638  ORF Transcript_25581/g.61638 Transcript_25581/m.61638 type:complete len:251 (+) Transcript_25581:253-1005(+)